jgi:hypothetical protein
VSSIVSVGRSYNDAACDAAHSLMFQLRRLMRQFTTDF